MNASLDEKLQNVQWGEYRIGDLFEKLKTNNLKMKVSDLSPKKTADFTLPVLTAGIENQGLNNYAPRDNATILKNVISISANGANTGATFYQNKEFTVLQDAYAISFKGEYIPNDNQYLFLTSAITKSIYGSFAWTDKAGWEKVKKEFIQLPTKNGKIDFEFMNAYISELEEERISELSAYLTVSGLDSYELSSEEKDALEIYNDMVFDEYKFKDIFNNIKQGRRLKKDDQIIGNIPFVMSGRTNTGVVGYISNPIALFSKNSITIDIFGNSFYRNYDFGAGDDTGIYWNSEVQYPKETMLYFTTAMEKALFGKYSYGKKLRSSQSFNFKMQLPTKNNEIDFTYMELLISAVKKLVIKDVVLYADNKINATKKVISKN
ncbi:restriction endonuclease subunit S [Dialister invisus]|uniref:restriction endonuclease subunit S n=1 Tax=Dialister invisus TaxID=218538 RepID=UPI0027B9753D|nr:restriction endonuclease subunit S [Dialister invisus]